MDTKELMIGDFVYCEPEGCVIKVREVREDAVVYDRRHLVAYDGELQSIPITDDILEQIAEYHDYRDFRVLKGKGGQLLLDANQRDDGTYYMLYTDDEALWRGDYFACCRYVHELQHILRVTGHGDLADNLKVEQV